MLQGENVAHNSSPTITWIKAGVHKLHWGINYANMLIYTERMEIELKKHHHSRNTTCGFYLTYISNDVLNRRKQTKETGINSPHFMSIFDLLCFPFVRFNLQQLCTFNTVQQFAYRGLTVHVQHSAAVCIPWPNCARSTQRSSLHTVA